jgi:hypothetical protein
MNKIFAMGSMLSLTTRKKYSTPRTPPTVSQKEPPEKKEKKKKGKKDITS